MSELLTHLKKVEFNNQIKKLKKKIKNKTVVIYGTGLLFQEIIKNYDLSDLNIIGISDRKYRIEDEGKLDLGYKIIPYDSITKYKPDYVLVSTLNFLGLLYTFRKDLFKHTKTKVLPFVDKPFKELLKEIFI